MRCCRWLLGLVGAVAVLSGCEDPPSELVVAVSTFDDGALAGSGEVCEVAGSGECSLRAALDLAASTDEDIVRVTVPSGSYVLDVALGSLVVDRAGGRVVVVADAPGARIEASVVGGVDVVAGFATFDGVAVVGAGDVGIRVVGGATLSMRRSAVVGSAGDGVVVEDGGALVVADSTLSSNGMSGVRNDGLVIALSSTVTANGAGGFSGSASPYVQASIVADQAGGVDCSVAATSWGGNLDSDDSCGLGAGELSGQQAHLAGLSGGLVPWHRPLSVSPALDAVPVGELRCPPAAGPLDDQRSVARPIGEGCDIGAIEVDPDEHTVVVDAAHDVPAADASGGVCDDGTGVCTLRAAIDVANVSDDIDTVKIAEGINPTLTRTRGTVAAVLDDNSQGDLDVHRSLHLMGGGATLTASTEDRVLDHHAGLLVVEDLIITGGFLEIPTPSTDEASPHGAGVRASSDLVLRAVSVIGNETLGKGSAGSGGGLYVTDAEVVVERSLIEDNAAHSSGGGISVAGATLAVTETSIRANRSLTGGGLRAWQSEFTVDASTFERNEARWGGAVDVGSTASATISNTTLSGNRLELRPGTFPAASAIRADGPVRLVASTVVATGEHVPVFSGSSLHLTGSIIRSSIGPICNQPATSGGHNVISDHTCEFTGDGDRQAVDATIGPLADNGGPTLTHLPWSDGPVFEAIPPGTGDLCDGTITTDQRGVERSGANGCTIGAVEGVNPLAAPSLELLVDSEADAPDSLPGDGICDDGTGVCTLRAAIDEANLHPGSTIRFDAGVERIAASSITVAWSTTIEGHGVTIDAEGDGRVLHHQGGYLRLEGLTVTGGGPARFGTYAGGGILSSGDLHLIAAVVRDNVVRGSYDEWAEPGLAMTPAYGGGIYTSGSLLVERTTVASNAAEDDDGWGVPANGGGIFATDTATVTIVDSAIVGNDAAGEGGAIAGSGTVIVRNSTISGNTAGLAKPSMLALANPAAITTSTLVGSTASPLLSGAGHTIAGSVLVNSGPLCAAPTSSGGHNLATDTTCALVSGGDVQSIDALLGPLADNGGLTPTHLPWADSPAVQAIALATPDLCNGTISTDQRGVARPGATGCTIGSVEGAAPDPAPL